MNKKQLLLPILILFLACTNIYAQSQNEEEIDWDKVDWDKMENHLYWLAIEEGLTDFAEIHERTGEALLYAGNQWERATVHFKKAVKLDPKRYLSWFNLALIYISTDEGNEYLKKTIEAKPDFPPPYYWLAYNNCRNRKDKEALPMFEKYLEVAEGDANEAGRVDFAQRVLADLRSGKEGKDLKMLRRPTEEEMSYHE